ncbi:energy transducer TonB [Microbulbifer aggregans]|uniref:energy transducer TonB n=1 Tax=Microbulbifer aggregans TaxID=1769779 RepID=UPI001CFDB83E|nr:energy transducer TonB [Microbulbifer aggregans]
MLIRNLYSKFSLVSFALVILSAVPGENVTAAELGALFSSYQAAVNGGDRDVIVEAAAAVYDEAKASLPESSKSRAAATLNYSKALFGAREYMRAESVSGEAVALYEVAYGEDAIELVDPYLELARTTVGNLRESSGHRATYKRYTRKALSVAKRAEGKDSYLYAVVSLEVGRIALDYDHSPQAGIYLKDAQEAFSGPFSKYLLNNFLANFYLGKFHMARGSRADARSYLEAALGVVEQEAGPDSALEMTARAFLVDIYESLGEPELSAIQCRAIGKMVPFDMDQEPKPLFRRLPEYPRAALQSGREGYAIVNFTISDSGIPTDIKAVETSGSKSFGKAAEDFIKGLRYAPRFEAGEPVDTPGREMKISFSMAK